LLAFVECNVLLNVLTSDRGDTGKGIIKIPMGDQSVVVVLTVRLFCVLKKMHWAMPIVALRAV